METDGDRTREGERIQLKHEQKYCENDREGRQSSYR